MTILDKHPKGDTGYKNGDAVTSEVINNTINTAIYAKNKTEAVYSNMESAKTNAELALSKAENIETRANSGEFNTVTVETSGIFGFSVVDGILVLSYSGGNQPDMSINTNGELIYTF